MGAVPAPTSAPLSTPDTTATPSSTSRPPHAQWTQNKTTAAQLHQNRIILEGTRSHETYQVFIPPGGSGGFWAPSSTRRERPSESALSVANLKVKLFADYWVKRRNDSGNRTPSFLCTHQASRRVAPGAIKNKYPQVPGTLHGTCGDRGGQTNCHPVFFCMGQL